jgi:DHA1 family inner membrane transport protein
MCSAGITTPWQHRVEHLAGPGAILAASLPASAGNLGDAIGAFTGGHAINTGGVHTAILTAAVLATIAIAAAIASRSLRPAPSPATERALTPKPATVH